MVIFPEYQDVTLVNKFVMGELPFYILHHSLTENFVLHHHNFVELSLIVAGNGSEIVNGHIHAIRPGTITFLLPNHMHEIHCDRANPIELYSCMFDLNLLFSHVYDSSLGNFLLKTDKELPSHYDLDEATFAKVKKIMIEIMEEYLEKRIWRDMFIVGKLYEALILILRFHSDNGGTAEVAPNQSLNPIWDVIQYVHSHYSDSLTLLSVSKQLNWNPTYLSRTFSQQTGKTFIDYLHALRIDRAASLLVTTKMKITDISLEVGFEHFRSFSRVFKRLKLMSPSEFRESH